MEAKELGPLLAQTEEKIDLGRGALMLARTEYPDLNLDAEVARLDRLAAEAAPAVEAQMDTVWRVSALRSFLAGECGFHGNEQDYYDPKNSCLNQVLERKTGIPITLSVVYMEVGRRLGLPLLGVGLPGHFLVKYQDRDQAMFLDPFHDGRTVTPAECREMFERMYQGKVPFQNDFLAAVDKRYILLRMLNNLRGIYLHRQQLQKALRVVEMILAITPASGEDLKQRGLIQYRLQNYRQARQDLESYLFLNPQAADAEEVKKTLQELKRFSALLN
ncbi:MAG: tetratricopeptide repeat protein [Acidobacteria bacterium]|nr:tetratricopeptide repeat protein [Acidobacteriota bacterium]